MSGRIAHDHFHFGTQVDGMHVASAHTPYLADFVGDIMHILLQRRRIVLE